MNYPLLTNASFKFKRIHSYGKRFRRMVPLIKIQEIICILDNLEQVDNSGNAISDPTEKEALLQGRSDPDMGLFYKIELLSLLDILIEFVILV